MEIYTKEQFIKEQYVYNYFAFQIKELDVSYSSPRFGEIWICQIPVLVVEKDGVTFQTIARPVFIIDDGHEYFVKKDNRNYYVLKITSQSDSYHRVNLENYKKLGLQKESFLRIEVPLKVEKEQFLYKIGQCEKKDALSYLKKVKGFIQNYEKKV